LDKGEIERKTKNSETGMSDNFDTKEGVTRQFPYLQAR